MSDQIGQNVEASVKERESERERVNESERESKESVIQELRDEIDVLQRRVEEQKLRAQRDALATEVEKGAGGGRRRDAAARNSTSSSTMPTSGLGAQSGMSQLSLSRPNLTQPRPPKFDNIEAHFGMWRSKFKACLSSLGCLYVLKATDNPVMVGDMNVSQEELEQKHSPQVIRDARLVYGLLMESMTGYAFAEFRMQQAKSPSGAWQELENYYMPKTLAATHRLKREFETIRMAEGENPLEFLGRVDKAADELAMLGYSKSVEETHREQPLLSVYDPE